MTKQRHCFVTQVGDAIEALATALDPERKPPFRSDILDLLEWAAKDVTLLRRALKQAHADIAGLHDQLEEPQINQDDYRLNKLELEEARQQLADSVADRNNLAKALQFAVNMHTDGSEFFACLPDEITFAAGKELNEFFRLVDITNMEPKEH